MREALEEVFRSNSPVCAVTFWWTGDACAGRELVRSLWGRPERSKRMEGGYDKAGIHSVCIDPRGSASIPLGVSVGRAGTAAGARELGGPAREPSAAARLRPCVFGQGLDVGAGGDRLAVGSNSGSL